MGQSQILPAEILQQLRLLVIGRNLIRESARINPTVHNAVLSVYYIVIQGNVKVNATSGARQSLRGKHDILVPAPLGKQIL